MASSGSADFIEEAIDMLEKDPACGYFLIAARPGSDLAHRATRIPNLAALEWFRKAINTALDAVEQDLRN